MKILDAVYSVEQPTGTWFSGVLHAVAASLEAGFWVGGLLYDASSEAGLHVEAIDGVNLPPGWRESGLAMQSDPRVASSIVQGHRAVLCGTFDDLRTIYPKALRILRRDYYDPHQIKGQTMINGFDPSGKGCSLFIFSRSPTPLTGLDRDLFSCIATHLTTGYRLQRRLFSAEQRALSGVEAVIDPSGAIAHAEADARHSSVRHALMRAVRARESILSEMPRDPATVLRKRKGLVDARWTLLDHYEVQGRRYVVARQNAPVMAGPASLSPRERQVASLAALGRSNKVISYELGLAHSTVRVLVARACSKLAVRSRKELAARIGTFDSS